MKAHEALKRKLGIHTTREDDLLLQLLGDAKDLVLDVIGRDQLPERLQSVVVELAVIAYNRMGTEGESSRSEGGISLSYLDDLPLTLRRRLNNYPRKVRVMGNASDSETNEGSCTV